MKKVAVILFNLGGPDQPGAVEPFLFKLFSDPAIIRLIRPLRYLIAKIISRKRAPVARKIYDHLGGGSPILKNTRAQADSLHEMLSKEAKDEEFRIFIVMRYWHPFSDRVVEEVKNYAPSEIILLPLYPQYSTTTTQSSLQDWRAGAKKAGLQVPTRTICCYPALPGFIKALADEARKAYAETLSYGVPRLLFSAHGLPEKIIKDGDPYRLHCEMTVEALRQELAIKNLDSVLCFQSRVGPLKWIGPATDAEVKRAGKERVPLVVIPIAFVSDHSETLVEIDIEYRHLAHEAGVPHFICCPAVGTSPDFIKALAGIVQEIRTEKNGCIRSSGARACPANVPCCPVTP